MCSITAGPADEFNLWINEAGTSQVSLTVTDPSLEIQVFPTEYRGVDTEPYNSFVLMCSAEIPSAVIPDVYIAWLHNDMQLTHTDVNVHISIDNGVDEDSNKWKTSTLEVHNATTVSSGNYTCTATISLEASTDIKREVHVPITIGGPALPYAPIPLEEMFTVTARSAVIWWMAERVAYTPEQYTLECELTADNPDQNVIFRQVNGTRNISATNAQYSIELNNLMPFRQYLCNITSANTAGTTKSVIVSFSTLQDVPSGPPEFFSAPTVAITRAVLSWSPPGEADRNGIILSYLIKCRDENGTSVIDSTTAMTSISLDNLRADTYYKCDLFAFTSIGGGPAATMNFTTLSDVPGPVSSMTATPQPPDKILITWAPPINHNGPLIYYQVTVDKVSSALSESVTAENVTVDNLSVEIRLLEQYVAYNVSVRAANAGGLGKPVYEVLFTKEGVPSVAPQNVQVERLNATHMNITWEKISLEEARGFLTGYLITYVVVNLRRRRDTGSLLIGPNQTYAVIGGLSVQHQYSVTVSGVTVAGNGDQSSEATLETVSSSLVQLRFGGVVKCQEWRVSETSSKIKDIYSELVSVLQQYCSCPITADYISDAELVCPDEQEDVIIRARLFSISNINSSTLVTFLTAWVESEQASIVVNNIRITGHSTCSVKIESFGDPLCADKAASTSNSGGTDGTGPIVGSIFGGLALIAIVIVALYMYRNWYKRLHNRKSIDISIPLQNLSATTSIHDYQQEDTSLYEGATNKENMYESMQGAVDPDTTCTVFENVMYEPFSKEAEAGEEKNSPASVDSN